MIPEAALWIWAVTLGVVSFVVVPLAIVLLHRTLTAARNIERNLEEALTAGAGIASNTEAVAALSATITTATKLLTTTQSVKARTADIATAVTSAKDS